jgi:hypothetical protein
MPTGQAPEQRIDQVAAGRLGWRLQYRSTACQPAAQRIQHIVATG